MANEKISELPPGSPAQANDLIPIARTSASTNYALGVSDIANYVSTLGGGPKIQVSGNTTGTTSLVSSGTLFLAGGNNVTLSQNGQSITISANTAAAATLSVSAGASSGAFGGVTFSNSNNVSVGLNNGTLTFSASQSVQTQASGSIAGIGASSQTIAGSTLGATLGTNGLSLAVPGWITTASNGVDVSLLGNTSGALAPISTGTLFLAGGNNITLSQNANSVTISAAGGAAGGVDVTLGGNTSGTLSLVSSGTLFLAGGPNITLSQNGNSVSISGAAGGGGGVTTGAAYVQGNTTGQSSSSTYPLSSLNVSFSGLVTGGWSSNTLIISAPATTAVSQSLYATGNTVQSSSGAVSLGGITFQGTGGVSVGVTNGSVVISGASGAGGAGAAPGLSTFGNTAGTTGTFSSGTYVLAGVGPISLSQSTNTNGATLSISAPATSSLSATGNASISVNASTISIGANAAAISIGGNSTSAGGGYSNVSSGTLLLAGGNNITLSQNGASVTISAAAGGGQASLYALGNTTQNSSTTLSLNALSFNALGEMTIGYSNGSIQFSAPPSSVGVSTGGNTAGNTGTYSGQVVFAGGNNITLSVGTAAGGAQTISIAGAAGAAATGISGLQVSNTTYTSGTVTFQNANGISFGSSGANGISASYTQSGQAFSAAGGSSTFSTLSFTNSNNVSFSNTGGSIWGSYALNVSAGAGTSNALSGLTFSNSNNVTFGLSTGAGVGTITASVPATSSLSGTGGVSISVNGSTISIGAPLNGTMSYWDNGILQGSATVTQNGIGSVVLQQLGLEAYYSISALREFISVSVSTSSNSSFANTISVQAGIYTLTGSTLSLASSGSQSYAFTNTSNNSSSVLTGIKGLTVPLNATFAPGNYWLGLWSSTASANANWATFSNVVQYEGALTYNGLLGSSAGASNQPVLGGGIWSTTSAGLPASVGLSQITGSVGNIAPFVNLYNVSA